VGVIRVLEQIMDYMEDKMFESNRSGTKLLDYEEMLTYMMSLYEVAKALLPEEGRNDS
jgi:hypothetical protein